MKALRSGHFNGVDGDSEYIHVGFDWDLRFGYACCYIYLNADMHLSVLVTAIG